MTIARAHLVDTDVTRWYHCISRCVRRAFLLGEGATDRKAWIESRLRELADIFSLSVAGFAILDNHLHVLLRLDPDDAAGWSDEDVARRWGRLFPPRDRARQPLPVSREWVEGRVADAAWVATARGRLASLSWFMRCLKEPLSRMANREDGASGAFFESRYKSVAILDEGALLATCAYIDLNPVAAGIAALPEAGEHTSIRARVEHIRAEGRVEDVEAAGAGSLAGSATSAGLEDALWLCPVEDRRGFEPAAREGMIAGLPLGGYLMLVDYTGRLLREGKAAISREVAAILERLGSDVESWGDRLRRLAGGRLLGRYFAASRERLREAAGRLGVHHLANLCGCAAR